MFIMIIIPISQSPHPPPWMSPPAYKHCASPQALCVTTRNTGTGIRYSLFVVHLLQIVQADESVSGEMRRSRGWLFGAGEGSSNIVGSCQRIMKERWWVRIRSLVWMQGVLVFPIWRMRSASIRCGSNFNGTSTRCQGAKYSLVCRAKDNIMLTYMKFCLVKKSARQIMIPKYLRTCARHRGVPDTIHDAILSALRNKNILIMLGTDSHF